MKLSEIPTALGEIKNILAGLVADKTKATAEALTSFSSKVSDLDFTLSAAITENTTLAGQVTDLTNAKTKLDADFAAVNLIIANLNGLLTTACLNGNLLELKGADGKTLAADASDADKTKAADAIPVTEKFKAYQGALNAAFAKANLPNSTMPAAPVKAPVGGGNEKNITRAEFTKLSPKDGLAFVNGGGTIRD